MAYARSSQSLAMHYPPLMLGVRCLIMDVRQNIKNQKIRVSFILILPIFAFVLLMQIKEINELYQSINPSIIVPTTIALYSGFYGFMVLW